MTTRPVPAPCFSASTRAAPSACMEASTIVSVIHCPLTKDSKSPTDTARCVPGITAATSWCAMLPTASSTPCAMTVPAPSTSSSSLTAAVSSGHSFGTCRPAASGTACSAASDVRSTPLALPCRSASGLSTRACPCGAGARPAGPSTAAQSSSALLHSFRCAACRSHSSMAACRCTSVTSLAGTPAGASKGFALIWKCVKP